MILKWPKKKKRKATINYSQCWEDTYVLLEALAINPADRVLSIGSGGDNSLAILSKGPESITIIDQNECQNFLFELKHQALLSLNCYEVLEFVGLRPSQNRMQLYNKVTGRLSKPCREFWDRHPRLIKKGINHIGKFERYLSSFRNYILPLAHSRHRRLALMQKKNIDQQKQFFTHEWNNKRWSFLFHVFFNRQHLKKNGRGQGMFEHNTQQNVAAHYKNKAHEALVKPTLFKNHYLEYIFDSKYTPTLPDYLSNGSRECIKNCVAKVKIGTKSLLELLKEAPDNTFSKFNLSDVFEAMSLQESAQAFHEIFRVAQPGARLVFWNNLVHRDVPPEISSKFELQENLINELKEKERVFFYNCFRIYKIVK